VAGYIPPQIQGDTEEVTAGLGTGSLSVAILDPSQIKEGAIYKVEFKSAGTVSSYKTTSYSITRTIGGQTEVIEDKVDSSEFGSGKFGAPFDGMALSVINDTSVTVHTGKTGWIKGFSNVTMNVIPDKSSPTRNIRWPADYEIEWLPEATITTPFTKMKVDFKVRNITAGTDVQAEVFDNNGDKKFNIGDDIVIIEYVGTQFKLTWRIQFQAPTAPVWALPRAGDIYRIVTRKPFATGDYFQFSTTSAKVDVAKAKSELSKIGTVPNPYISAASWERRNLNQTGRGERRMDFIHLPAECTIRIYTVTGALVKTLHKNSGPSDGTLSWNLISDDGMEIAYGLYIYHVEAPGIGEQIGKFAVIK
jgi:hypothetical protein